MARYCESCGSALSEGSFFCQNCGAPLKPGARFCENCGNKA